MVRKPRVDENGIKKGSWSKEEDDRLRGFVQIYGHKNWTQVPKFAGLSRCGKSCRFRWLNYLRPGVKRGNYTEDEDRLILNLHEELGNKWSIIASKLPGRSDNAIKNHWHSHLKGRAIQNSESSSNGLSVFNSDSLDSYAQLNHTEPYKLELNKEIKSPHENVDVSVPNGIHRSTETQPASFENVGSFWTEPFIVDKDQDDHQLISSGTSPCTFYYNDNIEFFW